MQVAKMDLEDRQVLMTDGTMAAVINMYDADGEEIDDHTRAVKVVVDHNRSAVELDVIQG